MDAEQALADLTEISSQIRAAAIFSAGGEVAASTLADPGPFVAAARELLEAAEAVRGSVAQLEAATHEGSVFVARDGDRVIAATTAPEPTVGLVFYDLKSALQSAELEPAKPKRTRRKKAEDDAS